VEAGGSDRPRVPRGSERLPRSGRVRKRVDYLAIQDGGRKLSGTHYLLFARAGSTRGTRFGLTVSRKVGDAVERNLVKRWLRESYRRMRDEFPAGLDVVVVARPSAAKAGYGPTARELATLARRLRGR
jgi:ribonuclease P protein component